MPRQNSALPDASYQFFLSGLRGHWDPPALETPRNLVENGISWQLWLEFVHRQRLAPLLYKTLRGLNLLSLEAIQSLRQVYLWTANRNILLLHELGMVLDGLQTAGVSVMPIKGGALAETVYGNPAVRPMADLDLLVTPAGANAACATLTALGYTTDSLEPWPNHARRYRQVLEFIRKAEGGLYFLVDLHWGVVDVPYYERIPIDTWFEGAETAILGGVETHIPSAEDHLLLLCAHLAFHERYSNDLLRHCDLAAIIHAAGETLNWETVFRQAAGWQMVIPLQRTLLRLESIWPRTVSPSVVREADRLPRSLAEKQFHRWVLDRHRNPTADVLLFVASTPGILRKFGLFLEQTFPSPIYMRQRYHLRYAKLWPLAYLWRAALIIKNLMKRDRTYESGSSSNGPVG